MMVALGKNIYKLHVSPENKVLFTIRRINYTFTYIPHKMSFDLQLLFRVNDKLIFL